MCDCTYLRISVHLSNYIRHTFVAACLLHIILRLCYIVCLNCLRKMRMEFQLCFTSRRFIQVLQLRLLSYFPRCFYDILLYADEWKNFLARIGRDENTHESELNDSPNDILELRFWASYRGQTLARTGISLLI